MNAYVPGGTDPNEKLSTAPRGREPLCVPLTSSVAPVDSPPSKVGVHARPSALPFVRPSRFAGADGATGTFTCVSTSFEAALVWPAASVRRRM